MVTRYICPRCGFVYETAVVQLLRYANPQPVSPCPQCHAHGDAPRA